VTAPDFMGYEKRGQGNGMSAISAQILVVRARTVDWVRENRLSVAGDDSAYM
jgi:hypothetical protein